MPFILYISNGGMHINGNWLLSICVIVCVYVCVEWWVFDFMTMWNFIWNLCTLFLWSFYSNFTIALHFSIFIFEFYSPSYFQSRTLCFFIRFFSFFCYFHLESSILCDRILERWRFDVSHSSFRTLYRISSEILWRRNRIRIEIFT